MTRRLDVKIVLMLLFTALVPLSVSVYLVAEAVNTSLDVGLNEEIAGQIERGVDIHRKYIEEVKEKQRARLEHIVDSAALHQAASASQEEKVAEVLEGFLSGDDAIRIIRLSGPDGRAVKVEAVDDPSAAPVRTLTRNAEVSIGPYTSAEMVFGIEASIIDGFAKAGQDMITYKALASAPPAYLNRRVIFVYLILLAVIVSGSIIGGVFWTRRLVRRIHRLSEATTAVAHGDMSVRVDPGGGDEVGALVESFNGMVAELSVSRTRIEYLQKISAWQEMARRLAHEIKNPLTPIHLAAQQLREKYQQGDPEFERLLDQSTEIIEEEVATLRRLTSDFSSFARLPEVKPEIMNLQDFLEECESSLSHISELGDVAMVWEIPSEPIPVSIDRMMLKRVIDNLTRNAAEALVNADVLEPQIRIHASKREQSKHPEVMIRVEDNGPGIMPEHHPSIFDPYFTTKTEGTGLGLAISKKIVLEHGGRIWIDEASKNGAIFVVVLPMRD